MTPQITQDKSGQRIRATRSHLDALVGTWNLGGDSIEMVEEPGQGVLVAMAPSGERVHPITVISRGSKI